MREPLALSIIYSLRKHYVHISFDSVVTNLVPIMKSTPNYSRAQIIKLVFAISFAQFCLSADIATMSIATSALMAQFSSNVDELKVAGTVYPLVGAALMLISGVIGLYVGWRRLLITGLFFGLASSLSKLYAPSIEWITLVSRTLAGFAGVAVLPSTVALVVGHIPAKKRASVFGILAASTGLAAAFVPIVSGWMFDTLSWKSGFYATAVFYGLAILAATFWIAPLHNQKPNKFDAIGCLLSASSMLMIILGLLKSNEWGILTNQSNFELPIILSAFGPAAWMIIAGLLVFGVFVKHEIEFEKKHDSSLIPSSWFKNTQLLLGLAILVTMYIIFGGLNFSLVAFVQVAVNLTALQTGIIILIFAISMIIFAVITPLVFKSISEKSLAILAFFLCSIGSVLLLLASDTQHVSSLIYIIMIIFGAGIGILSSQAIVIVTNAVGEQDAERTGGLQATVRNVGIAIGIAVIAGMGQYMMEQEIKDTITHDYSYSASIRKDVKTSSSIPYIKDDQLLEYLKLQQVGQQEQAALLELNANARLTNFHASVMLLLTFSLLGTVAAIRLKKV